MNDNDIIKALECCNKPANEGGCLDCPLKEEKHKGCSAVMIENAIDLINRQKAEIEGLQRRIVFWKEDLNYNPKKERSEAIKEFAERLKESSFQCDISFGFYSEEVVTEAVSVLEIDNLVEEMTGEINEKQ